MYPVFRYGWAMLKARRLPPLGPFETHVSRHRCWPWDIDLWLELNNGRTLTLYDLGRIPLAVRTGLLRVLRERNWGMVVAGCSVRYRRRVRAFDRIEIVSRLLGWDARFLYTEQAMWRGGECANHMLVRSALVSAAGIVPPAEAAVALGLPPDSPALPPWAAAWIAAEAQRPWPPRR